MRAARRSCSKSSTLITSRCRRSVYDEVVVLLLRDDALLHGRGARSASVRCGSLPSLARARTLASIGSALITASIAKSSRPTTSFSSRGM
jgi:hypothetical protein